MSLKWISLLGMIVFAVLVRGTMIIIASLSSLFYHC